MKITLLIFFPCLWLIGCNDTNNNNQSLAKIQSSTYPTLLDNNPLQYELSQKSELTPIYDQFYRNKNGYIYQRTIAQRNINGKLQDVEYFNDVLSQDIDPMTFEQSADSWYAKDKNQIYVSRPTSGGMQINPLKEADLKSFRPLDYNLAVDKNHYYQEGQIIENFNPNETQIIKNPQGQIIALQSHEKIYHLDD